MCVYSLPSFLPCLGFFLVLTILGTLFVVLVFCTLLLSIPPLEWCLPWSTCSVQFSHSVMSNFLDPMDCSTPGVPVHHQLAQNHVSCPSSWWCHPTISSSVIPFSSCLLSYLISKSFPRSQFIISGGQRIGATASASVLPTNIQDWFPLGWIVLISLQSKGLSRVFSHTTVQKHQFFGAQPSLCLLSHPCLTTGKTIALTRRTFVGKVMSLLFNTLSKLVIAFLARSKHLLISWLQSPSTVILEPKKIKSHCFRCFPICLPWSDETRCHDLHFLNVEF